MIDDEVRPRLPASRGCVLSCVCLFVCGVLREPFVLYVIATHHHHGGYGSFIRGSLTECVWWASFVYC